MIAQQFTQEKPQNGAKGLKHWRYDLLAGIQVALVSLPLSLGIAIASGAPAVTGVISSIIAGLIFPFLGGAYVTISGPAAGLAPALLSGMLLLGGGDLAAGYPLLLVAICLTGLVQIVLSLFKAGRFALFLPVTVVEGMLAAIGTIIIIKQIPALLGVIATPAKSMFVTIANLPAVLRQTNPAIAAIGGVCLFLLFYLNRTRHVWMRRIPPPLLVAGIGIGLGYLLQLDAKYLITMPHNLIEGGITLPAFEAVWNRPEIWWSVLLVVITLTLIDGIESLATIAAVDKIDPYQRKSDPNVTLRAMGVSNTLSSIFGGLTIIPGGVKSRVNIDAGGRTLWANFYNAMFLIVFLFIAKDLIARIPLAAISAILVYVGWRLCEIQVFRKTYAIGRDQMLIFLITIAAILATDLLYGILLGIAAEIGLVAYLLNPSFRAALTGRQTFSQTFKLIGGNFAGLFRSPVIKTTLEGSAEQPHCRISLGSIVCFNLLPLDKLLQSIPPGTGITLAVTESGRVIDHTAMEYLHQFQETCQHAGRPFDIQGLDNFYQFTTHSLSSRMHDAKLVKKKVHLSEREQQMSKVAQLHNLQFAPAIVATLNVHDFIYLRRGSDRQKSNVISGNYHGCHLKLYDYSHTAAPDYYAEHRHTIVQLGRLGSENKPWPNLALTPGHYLERYLVEYQEVDITDRPLLARHYRLYALDVAQGLAWVDVGRERWLVEHPGFYIEIHNNVLLAFHPEHDLESPEAIESLLAFAESLARLDVFLPANKPKEEITP
jgi:carbonic anhydrase